MLVSVLDVWSMSGALTYILLLVTVPGWSEARVSSSAASRSTADSPDSVDSDRHYQQI